MSNYFSLAKPPVYALLITPSYVTELYHDENKLHVDDDDDVHFVLDQHA